MSTDKPHPQTTDPGHPQNAREFRVWEHGRRQGHAEAVEHTAQSTPTEYQAPDLIETARALTDEMDSATGDAIRAAMDRQQTENERLRRWIDAAVGEFERGYPLSALQCLLNAQEGLS